MKTVTEYEAFDGKRFPTAEECKAYEDTHAEARLCGLKILQVHEALARETPEGILLADAFEKIGNRCAQARREAGELRRKPNGAAQAEASA